MSVDRAAASGAAPPASSRAGAQASEDGPSAHGRAAQARRRASEGDRPASERLLRPETRASRPAPWVALLACRQASRRPFRRSPASRAWQRAWDARCPPGRAWCWPWAWRRARPWRSRASRCLQAHWPRAWPWRRWMPGRSVERHSRCLRWRPPRARASWCALHAALRALRLLALPARGRALVEGPLQPLGIDVGPLATRHRHLVGRLGLLRAHLTLPALATGRGVVDPEIAALAHVDVHEARLWIGADAHEALRAKERRQVVVLDAREHDVGGQAVRVPAALAIVADATHHAHVRHVEVACGHVDEVE